MEYMEYRDTYLGEDALTEISRQVPAAARVRACRRGTASAARGEVCRSAVDSE